MFVEDLGDRVIFSLKPHCIEETGPEIPDSLVDASFYAMLLLLRRGTGRECYPRAVALRRAPGNEKFYESYYGCPVTCSAPLDVITFSREDAYAPFADYNKELFDLLTRNTYTSGRSEAFLTQVGWMVERHLSGGRPSLDEVASEMGMGRRSFQRMLSAAGTTFHKIVAGKRRLLAREYLRDPALSLTEISCLLGFDDQNSFSRSFRQWRACPRPAGARGTDFFLPPRRSPLLCSPGEESQGRGPRVPCVTPEASAPGSFPACVPDLVNSMSPRPSARRDSVRDDRPGCGVKPAGGKKGKVPASASVGAHHGP